MATQVVRQRVESPARWWKALERAIVNGIEPLQIAGTGEWVVTSATKVGTVYRTAGRSCECEAALAGDPVCQHRAVVRFTLGWLTIEDGAPETAATVDCAGCNGRGWNYFEIDGGRSFPGKEPCRRCDGSGQMPVRIVRHPRPAALAAD